MTPRLENVLIQETVFYPRNCVITRNCVIQETVLSKKHGYHQKLLSPETVVIQETVSSKKLRYPRINRKPQGRQRTRSVSSLSSRQLLSLCGRRYHPREVDVKPDSRNESLGVRSSPRQQPRRTSLTTLPRTSCEQQIQPDARAVRKTQLIDSQESGLCELRTAA